MGNRASVEETYNLRDLKKSLGALGITSLVVRTASSGQVYIGTIRNGMLYQITGSSPVEAFKKLCKVFSELEE